MAVTRELSVKVGHASGETTTLKFSPLADASQTGITEATIYKFRIGQINNGTVNDDYADGAVTEVDSSWNPIYQSQLLSKSGSPATSIIAGTLTVTDSTRIYTRSA